jgi:hypothetical protein
VTEPAVEEAV